METKKEVNYKIHWHSSPAIDKSNGEVEDDRKHYFSMLRDLLQNIEAVANVEVLNVLEKFNVHFADIDDFPRVNIDEPKEESKNGK